MTMPAQVIEALAAATGLSRTTLRDGFDRFAAVLGDRLGVMQQRIGGIMANAGSGGTAGLDDTIAYTDASLSRQDKSQLFGALGLGFIGGLLLAGAAGEIVVILVALLCLVGAGLFLLSFLQRLMARATAAIDAF
ncbi:hypothetical protein [Polymorphobacter fuscus]|uniref:hypothetical protein n=1 Tax=Sandarakinorhabdus fusca TaxID=1439888 RepID=UPI001297AB0E|nr:hypothetical protein [Polymorphobacter fuscus]NJC07941.1 hypothetical protein [Polymorphobacter fuscus]